MTTRRLLLTALAALVALVTVSAPPAGADTDYSRMILVLDSSGSMKEPAGGGTSKIDAAKSALDRVIGDLPDQADVGLRVFGAKVFDKSDRGACTDSQLVVRPGTDNRDDLKKAVGNYKPYGETPIAYSLREAAKDLGDEGSRSIVLVSDGIATCQPDPCDVAAELAEQGIDLQIDVVGLGVTGKARDQLRCIASRGNGTYYDADSADDIAKSLQTVTKRALRPFELDGTPIAGGPSSSDATNLQAGVWSDQLGPSGSTEGSRWYRYERTYRGSSVIVGTTLRGAPKAETDGLKLTVTDENGESCLNDGDSNSGNDVRLFGVGGATGAGTEGIESKEGCADGPLLINVARDDGSAVKQASAYSLRIAEEGEPTNVDSLPEAIDYNAGQFTAPPSGDPTPVVGGTSLGRATTLTDGTYSGSIVAGETQVFRVKLDWGQSLAAQVTSPEASSALKDAKAGDLLTGLQIANPVGAPTADDVPGTDDSGVAGPYDGADTSSIATLPVRWRNRDSANTTTYLPGWYYLVYSAKTTNTDEKDRNVAVPYTLSVQTQGEVEGAPTYADGEGLLFEPAASSPKDADPKDTSSDDTQAATATDEDGLPVKVLAASGLGVVALLCAGAGLVLVRRRG